MKILALASFVLINLSIYEAISLPKASSYEVSVYDVFPTSFWYFLIIAVLLGQLVMVISAVCRVEGKVWTLGMMATMVATGVLLLVPQIRGYFLFGDADPMTHIGHMRDIILTGHIGSHNPYPLDHVLGVSVSYISGADLSVIVKLVPLFFALIFSLALYSLVKRAFKTSGERMLAMALCTPLPFGFLGIFFLPNWQAFMLLPLIFYAYYMSCRSTKPIAYLSIFVLLLLVNTLFHPLAALVVIGSLLILGFCTWMSRRMHVFNRGASQMGSPFIASYVALIFFFSWNSYVVILSKALKEIVQALLGGSSATELKTYSGLFSSANLGLEKIVGLVMSIYGQYAILSLVSLACVVYIFRRRRDQSYDIKTMFAAMGFIVFLLATGAAVVLPFPVQFERMLYLVSLFSILLIPIVAYELMTGKRKWRARVATALFVLVLVGVVYFSTFNLYSSPATKSSNPQVVESTYVGMDTFFSIRSDQIGILEYGPSQDRYFSALYGINVHRVGVSYMASTTDVYTPVDHFGYPGNASLSDSYNRSMYFILDDSGRTFYPSVFPEYSDQWRYASSDFVRLKTADYGVGLVYSNGNLEVYLAES